MPHTPGAQEPQQAPAQAERQPQAQAPDALRVAVIVGSTREGRVGDAVGGWFAKRARQRTDLEIRLVDLADFSFPERYPERASPDMAAFCGEVGRAEGFVVVTPEYNRSFPASLKQAIDFAYDEWHAKPVAFVSYGCRSAGLYAVEALRSIFTELHTVTVRDGVSFDLLGGCPGEPGRPGEDAEERAVASMLDQLVWWGLALREARAARPYVT
ncbi:NADPH-dependent oxidoreductase [Streptomyces armeniacus]|uniref:NADPH-dependent oxidoreductase n=1 Tax=Streptomyces armeniacus TaxID=83291 RepID=A0A345XZ27_9ACTN|nr:NAD(P)H-dependent oxidoreductase [Streptomyces armeniacus]AXK36893.1 NADPH-dependent oxidoreductase [Streptomyces armeniacus]